MNRNGTAVILIVLALGIYFTFTRGIFTQVKAVQVVNNQYTSAISNAEQLIKVREKVLTAYNDLSESDRERLDKMIPNTVDNIRLIIDLNAVAARHGFALKNVKATTPPKTAATQNTNVRTAGQNSSGGLPTPVIDTVTITFSVDAPYLEFISFMQDLEANLRIMDLSRLGVSVNEEGSNYSYSVELKTYWLRQ